MKDCERKESEVRSQESEWEQENCKYRSQEGNGKTVNTEVRIGDGNQNVKMEDHESGMQDKIWNFKSVSLCFLLHVFILTPDF